MRYLANVTTLEYDEEKCTGCGRCVEVCPQAVFEMNGKKAAVVDRDACMECGACALNCDDGALAVLAGVGCAEAIVRGMLSGNQPECGCSGDGAAGGCC